MRPTIRRRSLRTATAGLFVLTLLSLVGVEAARAQGSRAPNVTILHSFSADTDGQDIFGGLVIDQNGALYGTALAGGTDGAGTVFRLAPASAGQDPSVFTVLHHFLRNADDGGRPIAGLVADAGGAFYGTTLFGGASDRGTVFRLKAPGWKPRVLLHFGGAKGENPNRAMIFGADGALYGVTQGGGTDNLGTVFKLIPPAPGRRRWREVVLHSFAALTDGHLPEGRLVFGDAGELYGTTQEGGAFDKGIIFQLLPPGAGKRRWREKVLHQFQFDRGSQPFGGLTRAADGSLYGTTQYGGMFFHGTVFKLIPPDPGQSRWKHKILHHFTGTPGGGAAPTGDLLIDQLGVIFGTTSEGGASNLGTVYKLLPPRPGGRFWRERILHSFTGAPDGRFPLSGVIAAANGVLYGTTRNGGDEEMGTIFKVTGSGFQAVN